MIETRDSASGITRHEFSTVTPDLCRRHIENLVYVRKRIKGSAVTRYLAEVDGVPVEITSTPSRTLLFSPNRYALEKVENALCPGEWEYDNSTRLDYMK